MFVKDLIKDSFKEWNEESVVLLQAPTGSGKTTFILVILLLYAIQQNIHLTYFCNRRSLKLQIKEKLATSHGIKFTSYEDLDSHRDFNGISVFTYQEIENTKPGTYWMEDGGLSIYDECHYFLEDAMFNPKTNISWDLVKNRMTTGGSIFISATMQEIRPLILTAAYSTPTQSWHPQFVQQKKMNVVEYMLPENYDYLNIFYYEDENEIIDQINQSSPEDRWLIFISNILESSEKYAELNSQDYRIITAADKDSDQMKEIIHTGKFSCRVLLTTKVLDNGISLVDPSLKYIVLDAMSEIEAKQMIGRKRITIPGETVTVFLKRKKIQNFQGVLNGVVRPAYDAFLLFRRDKEKFFQSCFHDPKLRGLCIRFFDFHYASIHENELSGIKLKEIENLCCCMISAFKSGDADAFIKMQLSWFGKEDEFSPARYIGYQKLLYSRSLLMEYLEANLGCLTGRGDEFRQNLRTLVLEAYPENNLREDKPFGWKKIKDFFTENSLPYDIHYEKKGDQRLQFLVRRNQP